MRHAAAVFAGSLACLVAGAAPAGPVTDSAAPEAPAESFELMTPAEIEEHRTQMTLLTGEAREAYRSEHYRKLRERARAQGYELPETPPWVSTAPAPSEAEAAPQATGARTLPADIAARRAELQREVEARREELRKQVESRRATLEPAGEGRPEAPTEASVELERQAEERRAAREQEAEERRAAAEERRAAMEQAAEARREAADAEAAAWREQAEQRRKALQARIDQAIDAIGERRPAPPGYFPPRGGYNPPAQPAYGPMEGTPQWGYPSRGGWAPQQ